MDQPDDQNEPAIDFDSISQLIPRSRQGEEDAQEQLLVQVADYLKLMADRHMDVSIQQKVGPSDVIQQTYTRVIENFDNFRGGTAAEFRGWLKRIVINEMAKLRRSHHADKRSIRREQSIEATADTSPDFHSPPDTNLTPSSGAIASEQVDNFYSILQEMPDDYAIVIRLRSIERMSFKEIAAAMDRSHDSVTKLWYRAVLKFEELLKSSGKFEDPAE